MNRYRNKLYTLSLLLFVLASAWRFFAVPELEKMPDDFSYAADVVSSDNLYDEASGQFAGAIRSNTTFSYKVVGQKNNALEIQNIFDVREPGGTKIFSVERIYGIDRLTGQHVPGVGDRDRNGYLFGPKNAPKTDFTYWHINYDQPLTMHYDGEESILGLPTYHYTTDFTADQTKDLTNIPEVGMSRGVDLDVHLELWIEPTSGYLVKYHDSAQGYFYDLSTRQRTNPWNTFSNSYSFQSTFQHVEQAEARIRALTFFEYIIPVGLVVLAILFLILALLTYWPRVFKYTAIAPVLVLIGGMGITLRIWQLAQADQQRQLNVEFKSTTNTIERNIRDRLEVYEQALRAGAALFDSSESVTRAEWARFVKSIKLAQNYPGVQGVGYSEFIVPQDLQKHIDEIRSEGFPGYTVYPSGERAVYSSIIYLEPFDARNQRAFGFDMFQESVRHEAMVRARDSGDVAVSGKVTLVQETDVMSQSGFLMYMPVYRHGMPTATVEDRQKAIVGYVYSPFRINDLMHGILSDANYNIDYAIYDGTKMSEHDLMYTNITDQSRNASARKPAFNQQSLISIYDHDWLISFSSVPGYDVATTGFDESLWILIGGLIASLGLSGFVYSLSSSRARAMKIAAEMTQEIKARNNELSEYLDHMSTFNGKIDTQGNILLFNKPASAVTGMGHATLGQMNLLRAPWWDFDPQVQARVTSAFQKAVSTRQPVVFTERAKFADNREVFLNISFSPVVDETGTIRYVVAEGHDITQLKITETNLKNRTIELERLNKVMVGRELKMIELKDQLAQKNSKNTPERRSRAI